MNKIYKALSRRVKEWFARSGGTTPHFIHKRSELRGIQGRHNNMAPIRYPFWTPCLPILHAGKASISIATCKDLTTAILRVLALKAADVPILQSFTLRLEPEIPSSVLSKIAFLQISTLRRVSLQTQHVRQLPLNWAVLTSRFAQWEPIQPLLFQA